MNTDEEAELIGRVDELEYAVADLTRIVKVLATQAGIWIKQ